MATRHQPLFSICARSPWCSTNTRILSRGEGTHIPMRAIFRLRELPRLTAHSPYAHGSGFTGRVSKFAAQGTAALSETCTTIPVMVQKSGRQRHTFCCRRWEHVELLCNWQHHTLREQPGLLAIPKPVQKLCTVQACVIWLTVHVGLSRS
jgi:hypothetical protein